jgi:hypothetical protein
MKPVRFTKTLAGCLSLASTVALAHSSSAAMLASDNAGNTPYNAADAFIGENGGTGFQPWTGVSNSYVGDQSEPNSLLTNGVSFAVWAGNTSGVERSFLADDGSTNNVALDVGQSFSIDLALRTNSEQGPKGFSLGSASNPMFTFQVSGNTSPIDTDYQITDGSGSFSTSYAIQVLDPVALTFTLTSPTTYSFSAVDLATSSPQPTYTTTGTLANPGDISQVNLFQGGPANNDVYFNNLAITVPEPTSLALIGLGAGGLLVRRRKLA